VASRHHSFLFFKKMAVLAVKNLQKLELDYFGNKAQKTRQKRNGRETILFRLVKSRRLTWAKTRSSGF